MTKYDSRDKITLMMYLNDVCHQCAAIIYVVTIILNSLSNYNYKSISMIMNCNLVMNYYENV